MYVIRYEMRWHERFLEHCKRFYFTAKETGLAPVLNELREEDRADRAKTEQLAKERKDKVRGWEGG